MNIGSLKGVSVFHQGSNNILLPLHLITIDIGQENLAVRYEIIESISTQINNQMVSIANNLQNCIRRLIWYDNISLGSTNTKSDKLNENCTNNVIEPLINFINSNNCGSILVLVERQINQNVKAVRIEQHIISTFSARIPSAIVGTVDSKTKYSFFGIDDKKKRKQNGIDFSIASFQNIGDQESLSIINSTDKKDDLADTFLMTQLLLVQLGV